MSYQKERDEFIAIAAREGLPVYVTRKLLRYATTLQRLAVAQCNGDWPADNGERKVKFCPQCEGGFVEQVFRYSTFLNPNAVSGKTKVCPDCRTQELVRLTLPAGFKAIVGGDPRGCVLKITVPSGYTNDWGREGVCVPAAER